VKTKFDSWPNAEAEEFRRENETGLPYTVVEKRGKFYVRREYSSEEVERAFLNRGYDSSLFGRRWS
jgi:hypothetical protein